jgi:hypothetical protein
VLPLQQWPLAYWPDGSIKWTGFATVAHTAAAFRLVPGTSCSAGFAYQADRIGQPPSTSIPAASKRAFPSKARLSSNPSRWMADAVAGPARLICTLEGGASFTSNIQKVTVEQRGPVRATVKIEGVHKADSGSARMAAIHLAPLLLC